MSVRCAALVMAAALMAAAPVSAADGDPSVAALDRLIGRAASAARLAPAGERDAALAAFAPWAAERGPLLAGGEVKGRVERAESRLRAVLAAAPSAARAAALAAARPIDPLHENGAAAEEDAALAAYALTTLFPAQARPQADEYMTGYERYAGFTFIGALPDGRLLAAVPEECGTLHCTNAPFLLDKAGGAIARAAVEILESGAPVARDGAELTGVPVMTAEGVEITHLARAEGGCGTRWAYAADGDVLRLLRRTVKPACDGKPWTAQSTVVKSYR